MALAFIVIPRRVSCYPIFFALWGAIVVVIYYYFFFRLEPGGLRRLILFLYRCAAARGRYRLILYCWGITGRERIFCAPGSMQENGAARS